MNHNNADASIDQSIKIPDYFSCKQCVLYHQVPPKELLAACNAYQQAGRCRAETLQNAINQGYIQINLIVSDQHRIEGNRQ